MLAAVLGCMLALLVVNGPVAAQGLFGDGDAQRREAEAALRINELEGQIRNLNGQIEQMGFQLRQLQEQMVKMQKDTDFRLQELENGPQTGRRPPKKTELTPGPADTGQATAAPPAGLAQSGMLANGPSPIAQAPSSSSSASASQPIAPTALGEDEVMPPAAIGQPRQGPVGAPQVLGAPPQILGQIPRSDDPLNGAATDGPVDLGQAAQPASPRQAPAAVAPVPGVTPKYANVQPTPSARDEYDAAYGYILSGEYDLAERSFKTFLANHPTDRRAGSAQYWLGESFFQRNQHREATDAFLKSYTQYPDDVKAPDSLLKLGLAYQGLGERKAACNAYDELLSKYPKASKALRDRAQFEKTRGKCV